MSGTQEARPLLRPMRVADVPDVLAIQEPGAVASLEELFPQEEFPFPREEIAARWISEIADPGTDCFVAVVDHAVTGFVAVRGEELLHLGTAIEQWGSGLAREVHDAVLTRARAQGADRMWLVVFTGNGRARRFYEKLGWQPTGERTRSAYPPCPELLRHERSTTSIRRGGGAGAGVTGSQAPPLGLGWASG